MFVTVVKGTCLDKCNRSNNYKNRLQESSFREKRKDRDPPQKRVCSGST